MKHIAGIAAGFVAVAVLVLAGCGSGDTTPDAQVADSPTTNAATSTTPGDTSETAPNGTDKVNANTASVAEMTAAFEAAGVPNAAKWAREVEEYRPYTDDNWAHLREELDKYNIDDDTFERIVGVLEL